MARFLRLRESGFAGRPIGAARSVDGGKRNKVFGVLLLFIGAVSVHDAMLVILNAPVIAEFEKNPVGRWLIDLTDGAVWLFVLAKLAGTAVVCAALLALYERSRRLGLTVAGAVAVFQAGLLIYLCFW